MTLPYDQVGVGPPVVLLHAGVADRSMWSDVLPLPGFRAIVPDLPGFGEAAVQPGPQAPWEDVLALAPKRFALVGISFGGAVALRVAAVAPSRVSALLLVSTPPPGLDPSEELLAAWEAEEAALQRGDLDAAAVAVAESWAPPRLRARVIAMQRRAFELQQGEAEEAADRSTRASRRSTSRCWWRPANTTCRTSARARLPPRCARRSSCSPASGTWRHGEPGGVPLAALRFLASSSHRRGRVRARGHIQAVAARGAHDRAGARQAVRRASPRDCGRRPTTTTPLSDGGAPIAR